MRRSSTRRRSPLKSVQDDKHEGDTNKEEKHLDDKQLTAPLNEAVPKQKISTSNFSASSLSAKDKRGRPLYDRSHTYQRKSLLAHDAPPTNFKGFFNLFVILLVVTNFQKVLSNFITYGIRIRIPFQLMYASGNYQAACCYLLMHLPVAFSWLIERYFAPFILQPIGPTTVLLQLANAFLMFYLPYYTVTRHQPDLVVSILLICFSLVWLFKLFSFHHVCFDVRYALHTKMKLKEICLNKKEAKIAEQYPFCLTILHFYRFLVMPTMCFQFYYPSMPRVRWSFLFRHFFEGFICAILAKIIIEQYMLVTLRSSFATIKLDDVGLPILFLHFMHCILDLSIPNLYVWLLLFVVVFHHWCNILGEITCFGDRLFYEDWWNASSIDEYWRKWNMPIYNFLNRHVNKPLRSLGLPQFVSTFIIFTISAILHEYIISVPLQLGFVGLALLGFLAQIPLMLLSRLQLFQRNKTIGNVIFWVLFCFSGQPIGILSYFYLWGVKDGTIKQIDSPALFDLQGVLY